MSSAPNHKVRKHSKFSASGAERWFNCPGSVQLSEGLPDRDSRASLEGTKAHEVLEEIMRGNPFIGQHSEMIRHGLHAAKHIRKVFRPVQDDAELLIETRVFLDFIHPEAFGSLDYSIVEHFGTLHIMDYKYGMSIVQPRENLQFLFYALAVARKYDWNFKRVRMWTLQPRVRGFDGYVFWEITIEELRSYIPKFKAAIDRVLNEPDKFVEGDWCWFCKAKGICPLKLDTKLKEAQQIFKSIGVENGKNENKEETENLETKEKARKERKSKTRKSEKESKENRETNEETEEDFY